MVTKFIKKIFGNKSDRDIKKILPVVDEINDIFDSLKDKPDEWFPKRTAEFQSELKSHIEQLDIDLDKDSMDPDVYKKRHRERLDEKLYEILPEAFAMVKEACRRHVGKSWEVSDIELKWEMIPYDVQLIGGYVLHEGKIADTEEVQGDHIVRCYSGIYNLRHRIDKFPV